jgi:hypothetical protein
MTNVLSIREAINTKNGLKVIRVSQADGSRCVSDLQTAIEAICLTENLTAAEIAKRIRSGAIMSSVCYLWRLPYAGERLAYERIMDYAA